MLRSASTPRWRRPRVIVPFLTVGIIAAAVPSTYLLTGPQLTVSGPKNGALLGAAGAKDLAFRVVPGHGSPSDVTVTLDGRRERTQVEGSAAVVHLQGLKDGKHTVAARVSGRLPGQHTTVSRTFTVDTTPPTLDVKVPKATSLRQAVTVTGTAKDATKLTADGKPVDLHNGAFSITFPTAPSGVNLVAADAAGNEATKTLDVAVRYPNGIRAVHETGLSWAYPRDRDEALAMAKAHKLNAIEIDIKDEDGAVNFDPHVPLATQAGAVHNYWDPTQVAKQLHSMGVRLIGRIVTFKDPQLADWAWKHGHHDWVIQTPSGQPWGGGSSYGAASFTNFSNPAVRDYNLAIAKAAAKAGFDDIIFDYIRRPDGPWSSMKVPGLPHTNDAAYGAINDFTKQARAALHPLGAFVGAAIFAQAVNAPQDTAQNVPEMAKYLDVATPMDYPSHWTHGEYGVPNPNAGPQATHDLIARSLKDWAKAVKGTSCAVVPWLQAEDFRGTYTPAMVASQIAGAREDGMPGFILWNANAYYSRWESALTPDGPKVVG